MEAAQRIDAMRLLTNFLRKDAYYLASSEAYGDKGEPALIRALNMLLDHPEFGFVWLAYDSTDAVGVCVVSKVISTSSGGFVAKLDDLFVETHHQRKGVATAMLRALAAELTVLGVSRIDTSVHKRNRAALAFYTKTGFRALDEERLALLL